jgi:hypothetical protein
MFVEIEKPLVLSGWCVEQPENVLAETYTNVEMLENLCAGRETGWLRLPNWKTWFGGRSRSAWTRWCVLTISEELEE